LAGVGEVPGYEFVVGYGKESAALTLDVKFFKARMPVSLTMLNHAT